MIALAFPLIWRALRMLGGRLLGAVAPAFSSLGGVVPLLAPVGLGLLTLFVVVLWLRLGAVVSERDALEVERVRLSQSVAAQATAIAARDAALAVLAAEAEAAEARAEALTLARQEIIDAPPGDDGAVAPVLGRALERLRDGARP